MPSYTQEALRNAIVAVENDCSCNAAAKQYRIPGPHCKAGFRGAEPKNQPRSDRQKLSPTEETSLIDWIGIQYALGLPPTQRQARLAAQHMRLASGSDARVGKNWVAFFQRRNPSVRVIERPRIQKYRAEAVTPNKIKEMYAVFQEPLLKAIRPQHRWDMDETGITDGIVCPGAFFGPAEARKATVKTQKRSDWRSVMECISAEGNSLPKCYLSWERCPTTVVSQR